MKNHKIVTVLIALLLVSCAKQRDVDPIHDPDSEIQTKELLTGVDHDAAVLGKQELAAGGSVAASPVKLWIYKATVINTSDTAGFAFVGLQNNAKVGYFQFTKDKLQLISAQSIYPKETENTSRKLLNQWSVTHYDTRLAESNGKVSNKEVEENELAFNQKRYFKIDFSSADVSETVDFPRFGSANFGKCWSKKGSFIEDDSLEMSDDYMSFVVVASYQRSGNCASNRDWVNDAWLFTMKLRYSFKKLEVDKSFQPFVYNGGEFDSLKTKYGYFNSVKEVLNKKTGRIENIHFATRWNPKKDHHFFFAKGFPDKYKKIYNHPETGVFAKTNSSLAAAGVKARFYIHNNDGVDGKEKKFGDIRYSFINYITESSPSAPLGYGPSDSNPFTGEIISANSMVWTSSLKYYVKRLRDVDANQDATGEASLFKKMRRFLGYEATEWVVPMSFEKDMAGDVFHHVMKDNTYGVPFWNSFTSVDPQVHSFFNARDPKTFVHSLSDRARGEAINFTDYNVGMTDAIKHNEDVMHEVHQQRNGHCIYPVVEALGGVHDAITVGVDDQTIIDSILYRVAIHEFGHNLSLRHNFYGSVDKKNFAGAKSNSSSVMDYLDLEDEVAADRDWESYDKAALQYLYSNGKVDSPKFHMYCTDEHRPLNAMCSTWDTGTTPTEIIANMISDYEKLYFILNYRYDRAYWNTGYYAGRVFGIMWDIKKFLMMWRQDFTADKLNEYFKNRDDLTTEQKKDLAQEIQDQFHKSVEVSVAFFDSVVQQAASDRPWRSEFDSWSGAVTRLGIIYDKLFAVRFLLGDEGFMYNPSQSFNNISYLSYIDIPEVRQPIEKAFENALTTRVDMDTWFLGYSRELFSFNAMNPSNRSDTSLVERIKVVKLSAEQLKDDLKLDTSTLADIGTFTVNTVDTEFKVGATVGYVKIHGNYYLVEKYNSPYSYNIFQKIQERLGDSNINTLKGDLVDLYNMYQRVTR